MDKTSLWEGDKGFMKEKITYEDLENMVASMTDKEVLWGIIDYYTQGSIYTIEQARQWMIDDGEDYFDIVDGEGKSE